LERDRDARAETASVAFRLPRTVRFRACFGLVVCCAQSPTLLGDFSARTMPRSKKGGAMGALTRHGWLGVLFVLVPITSCNLVDEPASPSAKGPTCSRSDAACILSHLRVLDDNGDRLTLVSIAPSSIQPSQLAPGKGLPTVASATKATLTFRYGNESTGIRLPLTFTDPNGAKIGGCFSVRTTGQLPGPFGGFPVVAFRSVPDGKTSGDLILSVMPGFDSEGGGFDYELDLYPISAVDPTKEAIEQAVSGGAIAVGTPLTFPVHVGSGATTSNEGGASTCSSDTGCAPFGQRNCQPENGARCGGDGLCHCCLAFCSSSTNACSCTACNANCSGDRMCVGSTCVFKVGASPAE
jgi:hypothetical protein